MKFLPLLLSPLAALLVAAPVRADDLLLRSGKDITGVQVQSESYAKVEYKKPGGALQSVAAADVRDVRYGRSSPEFVQALALRDAGDLVGAIPYFLAAEEDQGLAAHVRATALVEAADALFTTSNFPDAQRLYERFLANHASSRHLPRALLGRGKALLFARDYAGAQAALTTLTNEVAAKGLGERWGLEAEFFLLLAAEAQGQDVAAGYQDLRQRAAASHQDIANKCALRLGRVHLGAVRLDEARALFDEIVASRLESEPDVVAGAFNGRGRVLFALAQRVLKGDGKTPPDREEALDWFRRARLDFLRVYVNYRGVDREQAEALYWAGQCFLNVAELDPAEADAKNTGLVLLKRCREQYQATEWGQKAASAQ